VCLSLLLLLVLLIILPFFFFFFTSIFTEVKIVFIRFLFLYFKLISSAYRQFFKLYEAKQFIKVFDERYNCGYCFGSYNADVWLNIGSK
jgi:hypothetical protein